MNRPYDPGGLPAGTGTAAAGEPPGPLDRLRGPNAPKPLSARAITAALETPACARRATFETAGISMDTLAPILGCAPGEQAQHAFARGNRFEEHVMADGAAELLALLRAHLGLPVTAARVIDLSARAVRSSTDSMTDLNRTRVRLTRNHLRNMLTGAEGAPTLLRHAMTTLDHGGRTAYLEQDALAMIINGAIVIIEVKSFPQLDGRADPAKADSARRQSAVYAQSLIDTVTALGFDPSVVSMSSLLVLPTNFSLAPTAYVVDLTRHVSRLRRQLATRPTANDLAALVPAGVSLPALPSYVSTTDPARRAANDAALAAALPAVTTAFTALQPTLSDACMSCPAFTFCRDEAARSGAVASLGGAVKGACGSVTSIAMALALADGSRTPDNDTEIALAEHLARAIATRNRRVS